MIDITYYGHSCFSFDLQGTKVLIDPFISGNPIAKGLNINNITSDLIFLTHGHEDHVADVETLAHQETTIVANYEVATYFSQRGLSTIAMNHGGIYNGKFGRVRMVSAVHSSSLPDGSYGGNPAGFVFMTPMAQFYVAGDTALTIDMRLIPELCGGIDFAILPIGGHFTMDASDAARAALMVGTKKVIGCHYDSFPPIKIDHSQTRKLFEQAGIELKLAFIGEQFTF